MKPKSASNKKLTTAKEQRKKYIIKGVVKRGSSPAWETTKKTSWRAFKLCFLLALLGAVVVGGMEGYRKLFWENPDYALRDVHVVSDGFSITREQVISTAGLSPGRNIYSYKLDAAREALRKNLSQIATLEIERILPNRVEITITERKPVAWVTAKVTDDPARMPGALLLDEKGVVFRPRVTEAGFEKLPVIGGVEMQDAEPGKVMRKSEMVAALLLLKRVQETNAFKILSIDASKGYCLKVTDQRRALLTFGIEDIDAQLRRLEVVRKEVELLRETLQTANLMLAKNIPLTFVPVEEPEPVEEAPVEAPAAKIIGAEPVKAPAAKTPQRRSEPVKPKTTPKRGNESVLKKFTA